MVTKNIATLNIGEKLMLAQLRRSNESFRATLDGLHNCPVLTGYQRQQMQDTLKRLNANISTQGKLTAMIAERLNLSAGSALFLGDREAFYAMRQN